MSFWFSFTVFLSSSFVCLNCDQHIEGQIWFLPRSLQLTSFQAYKLRVTHLYQLKQHSILVSVGEDEEGINPLVSQVTKRGKFFVLWTSHRMQWLSRLTLLTFSSLPLMPHVRLMLSRCCFQVKVWNLEKRDGGNPLCTRIFPAIPGNKPTVVSCLTVHENLNFMAIGK